MIEFCLCTLVLSFPILSRKSAFNCWNLCIYILFFFFGLKKIRKKETKKTCRQWDAWSGGVLLLWTRNDTSSTGKACFQRQLSH